MKSPDLVDTILTVQNDVAIVTLDRDDVRNALTGTAIIEDIISVCDWINKNREIGAMVLTGSGKAFSAGGNIKDMREKKGDIFGGQLDCRIPDEHAFSSIDGSQVRYAFGITTDFRLCGGRGVLPGFLGAAEN